jgi:hypothetical protein
MWRYRRITSSLFLTAIMASAIVVGTSLVRGGGDEPRVADPLSLLVRRVEALENRVAQLERGPQPATGPYPPVSPPPSEQNRVPENWRPFQFNGQTSYIVPITTSSTTDSPPTNRAMPAHPAR